MCTFISSCFQSSPFGSIPGKTDAENAVKGGWYKISVQDLEDSENLYYCVVEESTKDGYGEFRSAHSLSRFRIAARCGRVAFFVIGYAPMMFLFHLVNLVADIGQLLLSIPTALAEDYSHKGLLVSLSNRVIAIFTGTLCSLSQTVSRIFAIFGYAPPLMAAGVYGIFFPLEGMKFISKIESDWHGGVSYRQDVRHRLKGYSFSLVNIGKSLRDGRVMFLAYDLLKRVNVDDSDRMVFSELED